MCYGKDQPNVQFDNITIINRGMPTGTVVIIVVVVLILLFGAIGAFAYWYKNRHQGEPDPAIEMKGKDDKEDFSSIP